MLFKMTGNTDNEHTLSIFKSSDKAVELGPCSFAHCASSHSMCIENGAHSFGISSLWRSQGYLMYPSLWDLLIASPAQLPNLTIWYGLWGSVGLVIVMTFWYVFRNGLNFFELFKFYFHSGLITTPHAFYVYMTHVYSCFLCFTFHMITWPGEVIIILWSFWLWSSILQMHPHPHFLLLLLLHPHPYTHHRYPRNVGQFEEGCVTALTYGEEEDPRYTMEDFVLPRLGTAMVKLVLPSNPSAQQVGQDYWEPSPDWARFGHQ